MEDKTIKKQTIPPSVIGFVAYVYEGYYPIDVIANMFMRANVKNKIFIDEDRETGLNNITIRLESINFHCKEPLKILGKLLKDFMEQELPASDSLYYSDRERKTKKGINQINQSLAENNLRYAMGGDIVSNDVLPVVLLLENISEKELTSSKIELEIKRILKEIESDPSSAVHRASSLLEAVFKDYLDKKKIEYSEGKYDFSALRQKVVDDMKINPKNLIDENLRKISSGLHEVANGVMAIRRKASAAHGKSEKEAKENTINVCQAKLVVNAVATLSAYVLGSLEK